MNPGLVEALREGRLILFVGAGVSQNLNLPSFHDLIRELAVRLNFDPDIFETHGDYLALAEFYMLTKGISDLTNPLDKEWYRGRDIGASVIHKRIVELGFPIIYTTNFDTWLERAFDHYDQPHHKIVNVSDLTGTREGRTQIVKFHGDFQEASSIVLSETNYFERLNFESPLDIKLRADLLGRSVLFIGYSFQDLNMRLMLYRLCRQWDGAKTSRPKSFIFLTRPNPVQEAILQSRGVDPLVSRFDDPGQGLQDFLEELLVAKGPDS